MSNTDSVGIPQYKQRLLDEREELNNRLFKLLDFTRRPNFLAVPHTERELLISQSRAMTSYLDKLDKRIDLIYPYDSSR